MMLTLFRFVAVCLIVAVFPVVSVSQVSAGVLLEDDFESLSSPFNKDGDFAVLLDPAKTRSGRGVLQLTYRPNTTGPGFKTVRFPQVSEVYARWYEKYSSNWVWSGNGSKIIKIQSTAKPSHGMHWHAVWGSPYPELTIEWEDISTGAIKQNVPPLAGYVLGKWHCVEVYHKQDDGSGNGAVKLWFDGVLKLDYSNMNYNNALYPLDVFMISAFYNKSSSSGSTPNGVPQLQYRWIDDLAVSTARVGCPSDTGDKTPPSTPTGVRIGGQ